MYTISHNSPKTFCINKNEVKRKKMFSNLEKTREIKKKIEYRKVTLLKSYFSLVDCFLLLGNFY